ncbi:uncharacterized protein SPPG_07469 [Spizellomyces punctatus DAOM BR117]|uniref:N-acetyltransferase domain-containing protein n=1 Tax=Spizellomyces punctatus (strain DAOM BR117) TaxID=645134 RepID=A0A0L0H8U6_SPIPD|nr:uncharacterized protein SPPG_07469 [Spizellomyces punctatus DAOM BR117]KNC97073.1 hypothetical protein SPPG_07469 [Spizellomyces punctatus DAOM BR117]|eukprot:XP_016605113.1 hypothetical protein SPPG_07469 [Spizellomyces punctatus DAOM BR117]
MAVPQRLFKDENPAQHGPDASFNGKMTPPQVADPAYPIRDATEADVPGMLEIYNWCILNSVATFDYDPWTLEDRLGWFRQFNEQRPLIVAEDASGTVVGYCGITQFNPKKGYDKTVEITLYVHHEHLRKGLGKRLAKIIIARAKALGYKNIIALVAQENEASVVLFKKLWFQQSGYFPALGYKFGRDLDVVYMQLQLFS